MQGLRWVKEMLALNVAVDNATADSASAQLAVRPAAPSAMLSRPPSLVSSPESGMFRCWPARCSQLAECRVQRVQVGIGHDLVHP